MMKILIVEDEPGFRHIFRDTLENEGYQVLAAEDGLQGWEMAQSQSPDLILLDLVLPGLHGFEVLEKLRGDERTKGLPVIILSMLEDPEAIEESYKLGANDYLGKALYTPEHLLSLIRLLLEDKSGIRT